MITLGCADLAMTRRFYEQGLGWHAAASSTDNILFFQLGGIVLAFFPWDKLGEDTTSKMLIKPEEEGFRGMTLAYNVCDKKEVRAVLNEAEKAGGKIIKPAQDVFWGGHSGYFCDCNGHLWEVAWNPFAVINEKGEFIVP